MTAKINISVSVNKGEELPLSESGVPEVIVASSSKLPAIGLADSKRAKACVYCDSQESLSDEHVIPYALGGTVIIWSGSCESCRLKTQAFENGALNGEMQGARFTLQMPSRSKHRKAAKSAVLEVTRNGRTTQETFSTSDVPTLLSLPLFGLPRYFSAGPDNKIRVEGTVTIGFGEEPEAFINRIGAESVTFPVGYSIPVQFARTIAKIAYGVAWTSGQLGLVKEPSVLPKVFIDRPDELGRFVGTLPTPFVSYPEVTHRFEVKRNDQGLLYAEVQLFASAGAPTYLAILGELS